MAAKPLHWRKPTNHPSEMDAADLIADGIGGKYSIMPIDKFCVILWWPHDEFDHVQCATVEEAKELAEADWQARFAERTAS